MKRLMLVGCALVAGMVLEGGVATTLHNGIVLPSEWPPRSFENLTREVQRVPYLENRPAVVPIDVGRQFFVDDFLIEKTDLRREWHYPVKYAGNPILKPETPLEINRPSNSSARRIARSTASSSATSRGRRTSSPTCLQVAIRTGASAGSSSTTCP